MKGNIAQDKVLFIREVLMHLTIQEKVFLNKQGQREKVLTAQQRWLS